MNILILGCGYVGLTTGVALSYIGHNVLCVDKDAARIDQLKKCQSPIYEKGMQGILRKFSHKMAFATSIEEVLKESAEVDMFIIAVGTPQKKNGEADTSYVEAAARELAACLQSGKKYTIVIKSTVPIGTNRRVSSIVHRILQERSLDCKVYIVSNPEFLREGMALKDTLYPDRIVLGTECQDAVSTMIKLYKPILEQSFAPPAELPRPEGFSLPHLIITEPASAEMIKYAANAFLAMKISYINEIAGLCEKVGADVVEVARGIGLDHRIGTAFLGAGIGWGGSCFPKDTAALLSLGAEYNYYMPILEATREVNSRQRSLVIEKLQSVLKVIRGSSIGILGVAFKPDTDDIREAPAIDIVKNLVNMGAYVKAHDPVAIDRAKQILQGWDVEFYRDVYEMAAGCDALVLATEWEEYGYLDFSRLKGLMRHAYILDGRNFLKPEELKKLGFIYQGVGR